MAGAEAALMAAATAAHQAGRLDEADGLYRQLLQSGPAQPEVLNRLALVALAQGRAEDGVDWLHRTLALAPGLVAAWTNLGLALALLDRPAEALDAYDHAAALAPGVAELHARRADLLQGLGRPGEALAAYDQATGLDPALARAWSNRALVLLDLDRPGDALASAERAVALDPAFVDAQVNRGLSLRELNRLDESTAALTAAADAAPGNPAVLCNLGVTQLLAGDLAPGFRGHEQRWRLEPNRSDLRTFAAPLWLGEGEIAGRTLLLHAEQGFGDTIQFCRYAALANARGARVALEVQPALKSLLAGLDGVDVLVARGEPLPPFDLHCPLMSLPLAFGTTLATIPAPTAYLAAPVDRLAPWARAVPASPRLKVGLAWFGKPTHYNDRNRSIGLDQLMAVLPQGLSLYSLHDRIRPQDEAALAAYPQIGRFEGALKDFADTAALAAQMDLVVAVDTSVAHLAAALGRPTFILLPFAPDWRWLLGREDSPWYPIARLFRQPAPGDWDGALRRLGEAVAATAR